MLLDGKLARLQVGDKVMIYLNARRTITIIRPHSGASDDQLRWKSGDNQYLLGIGEDARSISYGMAEALIDIIAQTNGLGHMLYADHSEDGSTARLIYILMEAKSS
jgi:hypothetical protein